MANEWQGHPRSGMIPMPTGFHLTNGGTPCDMAKGPCSCGATHSRAGWVWVAGSSRLSSPQERRVINRLIAFLDEKENWQK